MTLVRGVLSIIPAVFSLSTPAFAAPDSDWKLDVGAHWFKHAASTPNEIGDDPVFERWEHIQQSPGDYEVHGYAPLTPLYFNMNFGVDLLLRYREHLMLKLGYDYSNPVGIGGEGHISYRDRTSGVEVEEKKSFSYTAHELTAFIGPIVSVADGDADIYMGFSPMGPAWVRYRDEYRRVEDGTVVEDSTRVWRGFFGSCRALLGIQVSVAGKLKLGSEAVFVFLNTMKLEGKDGQDSSFQFPFMRWNITARYELF